MISVLGNPTADDGLVRKLEATLLVSPRGKVAVLVESVPGVCCGVVVAASLFCGVCDKVGSWVRLSMGPNIRLDVLLNASLVRDVTLAMDGERVP